MGTFETNTITVTSKGTLPGVPFELLKDKILGKKYSLSISFVGPKKAQAINMQYRNHDYIPNTLSFPLSPHSGEIILCLEVIKKQYKDFNMDYTTYLIFIVIHSMLHLKGYDHGSIMEDKERYYLRMTTSHLSKNSTNKSRLR